MVPYIYGPFALVRDAYTELARRKARGFGLALAPVVITRPVGRKSLKHFQRHAL